MYKYKGAEINKTNLHAQLLGSGSILNEVLKAGQILEYQYNVATDVWSVTSYKQLYRDGDAVERWNMFHPSELSKVPYVTACFEDAPGVFVAASNYVKALPDSISQDGFLDRLSLWVQVDSAEAMTALHSVLVWVWNTQRSKSIGRGLL